MKNQIPKGSKESVELIRSRYYHRNTTGCKDRFGDPISIPTNCFDCIFGRGVPLCDCQYGFDNNSQDCEDLLIALPGIERHMPERLMDGSWRFIKK